jgi:hypothetical protein
MCAQATEYLVAVGMRGHRFLAHNALQHQLLDA